MTNVVALDNQTHRELRVFAGASLFYGDNQRFVQVIVNEFPLLALEAPVFLSKDAETGAFFCGAMLGIDPSENLFLEEGQDFQGRYRPLNLQRAPFFVFNGELAIDLDSPRVGAANGERLFTDAGEATPYLQSVVKALEELRPGIERTKIFIETLLGHKLIEPVEIRLSFDDGTTRELVGLYTIDQTALRALPDETVLDLFRRGYLQLIYTMLVSQKHVPALADKKNRRLLETSKALASVLG